jgi:transposase
VGNLYAGIPQRWLVVESDARKRADLKQLDKRIAKAEQQTTKDLKTLSGQSFACEADALAALHALAKGLKYHTLIDLEVVAKPHHDQPGRPPAGVIPQQYTYHPTATLILNQAAVALQRNQAGRFILATNWLELEDQNLLQLEDQNLPQPKDTDSLPHKDTDLPQEHHWSKDLILQEYKEQQSCERGFRFLKDPLFFASRVFIQKAQRVAALAMIMGLCLLVYSLGQRQVRQALDQLNETIPNQKGQPTAKPTLRWVLQCFQSVHLVWINGRKGLIKLTQAQEHILRFLGAACQQYYFLC